MLSRNPCPGAVGSLSRSCPNSIDDSNGVGFLPEHSIWLGSRLQTAKLMTEIDPLSSVEEPDPSVPVVTEVDPVAQVVLSLPLPSHSDRASLPLSRKRLLPRRASRLVRDVSQHGSSFLMVD